MQFHIDPNCDPKSPFDAETIELRLPDGSTRDRHTHHPDDFGPCGLLADGWYWRSRLPDDAEPPPLPFGPFATEALAVAVARSSSLKMKILSSLKDKANGLGVSKIAGFLLDDTRFPLWSGSPYPNQHHHGTGGLITHISEVVNMCLTVRELWYPAVNEQALFLAALMHDWGKLWDYEPVNVDLDKITAETQWQGTSHKRQIHHISRSAIEWSKAVVLSRTCHDIADEVCHAILAHHRQREWGSPVAPNTHIAWLVCSCDTISGRMDDCGKIDIIKKPY